MFQQGLAPTFPTGPGPYFSNRTWPLLFWLKHAKEISGCEGRVPVASSSNKRIDIFRTSFPCAIVERVALAATTAMKHIFANLIIAMFIYKQ